MLGMGGHVPPLSQMSSSCCNEIFYLYPIKDGQICTVYIKRSVLVSMLQLLHRLSQPNKDINLKVLLPQRGRMQLAFRVGSMNDFF
jgi:hypothetical protein